MGNESLSEPKNFELQEEMNHSKRKQNDHVCPEPDFVFRFRLWLIFGLDNAGLLERALNVFLRLNLFDFGAQFVRHSYRFLTTGWISFRGSCSRCLPLCKGTLYAIKVRFSFLLMCRQRIACVKFESRLQD